MIDVNNLNKIIDKKSSSELKIILESCRLRINDPLVAPPALLEILEGQSSIKICKRSNITLLKGKSKAGKTSAMALFTAAVLKQGKFMDKFYCPFENIKICLFDTEESKYDALTMARIICKLRGITEHPDNFDVFSLKKRSGIKERVELIEDYIYSNKLDFIVIDGIRDLIRNINSPEESTDLCTEIGRWNEETECHIFCIIHENKSFSDTNSRGHIGTEMTNKAETVLSSNREIENDRIFTITDDFPRGRDKFAPIGFEYKNGMPILSKFESLQKRITAEDPF